MSKFKEKIGILDKIIALKKLLKNKNTTETEVEHIKKDIKKLKDDVITLIYTK